MKHNGKKPHSVSKKTGGSVSDAGKRSGKSSRTSRKKRVKLKTADKVHIVLVAAVLILAISLLLVSLMYVHTAAANQPIAQPAETPRQRTEPAETPAPAVPPQQKSEPIKTTAPPPASSQKKTEPARNSAPPAESKPAGNRPVESKPSQPAALSPGAVTERPQVFSRGALVFVIDDAGNRLQDIEPFLKFPGALTIAVLPGLPYSAETARRIRAAGKEVFLHQPMEALGGRYPGPGAIMAGMTGNEIRTIMDRNLNEIGPVAGVNNHEGSRITMDEEAMSAVLGLCRERGLVFLDSRTTAETAAPEIARRYGMKIGERDIFIDNIQERTSMLGYINAGLLKAEQKGSAIMIGHAPTAALAPLLAELYSDLVKRGFTFSSVSRAINENKP